MNTFTLEDKVAIVTGGAHGIGRAIVELFSRAGAQVVIADIDGEAGEVVAAGLRKAGGEVFFCLADVSSEEQAARAVRTANQKYGRVDVLCNNAAYLGPFHSLLEDSREEWNRSIEVALIGARDFTRHVLPGMMERRSGSIINIASVQALVAGRNSAAYTTVKAALLGFTRSIACDYGKYNIRANAIGPGSIHTRISPQPGDELYQRQVGKTFLQRVGWPEEVAAAALFLASDAASYVTGAILPVDGGWTAM